MNEKNVVPLLPEFLLEEISSSYERMLHFLEHYQAAFQNEQTDANIPEESEDLLKRYYLELGNLVRLYNLPENWTRDEVPKVPVPRYVMFQLGQLLDDLLSGVVPATIQSLFFGRKRPGMRALQQRAVEAAVLYVSACNNSISSKRLVAQKYCVTLKTVGRWMKQHPVTEAQLSPVRTAHIPAREKYLAMLEAQVVEQGRIYDSSRPMKRARRRHS